MAHGAQREHEEPSTKVERVAGCGAAGGINEKRQDQHQTRPEPEKSHRAIEGEARAKEKSRKQRSATFYREW